MAESVRRGPAIQTRAIRIGDTDFTVELFFDPHTLPPRQQRSLSRRFGSRMKGGQPCLEVDEATAFDGITNGDYSVIGFAKNVAANDEASGSLQLYNWCVGSGAPQLWINDLCRITGGAKPVQSPLAPLLQTFEEIAQAAGVSELYLLVENKEPERSVLPGIYTRYGFSVVDTCRLDGDDSIVMRKEIGGSMRGGRRKTRRRKQKRGTRIRRRVATGVFG